MKILFEANSLFPPRTGIGLSTERLIRCLATNPRIGEIHLLFSVFPLGLKWRSSLEAFPRLDEKIRIHRLPLPLNFLLKTWNILDRPRVDRWIDGLDLIHGPAHVLPAGARAASVFTVHDASLFLHPEWYPPSAQGFAAGIASGVEKADQVIVPSEFVRSQLIQQNSRWAPKIHAVHHDVFFENVSLSKSDKMNRRREMFGDDSPYILWVGEINPRKNVGMLFAALAAMRKRGFTKLRLILAGSRGHRSAEFLSRAEDMGLRLGLASSEDGFSGKDVILFDYVPKKQLQELYSAAEVFLFPSWDEGFGFPVLEAMASGAPVVSSSAGALPEICGEAAALVDPRDGCEAFCEALEALLKDDSLYEACQEKGRRRVQAFQSGGMADKTFAVYEQAMSK
ncbi:MAG: glycosyltransferase family 4 protein [Candidatus Omnitrophica bacterium]|nr:glycosyltransferase family 4 protein [Candidatus Omnitrophota bacterium]